MYYEYFGLKQPPFKITPDTSLFFPGGNRGAVLQALIYAVTEGEGIVKVVGEVGTGKTMLCRMLELELPENVEVVYLANPSLSPEDILYAIAFELKLDVTETDNRLKVMNELQHYLLDRHADNRQIVVFVEEAQGMPVATLEEIRLLSNLETTQNKLLQIVLFGQPELDEKIGTREIRQLKERITYSFLLAPFKVEEVKDYLNSRMRTCGYRSEDVFSASAVNAISKYSKGLLRRINILADKALLAAYAGNMHKVTSNHVKAAARDSEFLNNRTFLTPALVSMVVLIFLVLTAAFVVPAKTSQGISILKKSFDSFAKSANHQSVEASVSVEDPTMVDANSENELPEAHGFEQPIDPEVAESEVTESSVAEEKVDTQYLPQNSEGLMLSETAETGQATVASTEESEIMDLSALISGIKIKSPSDLDVLLKDVDLRETSNSSKMAYKSSVLPEPVAIGLNQYEFERLKQQLLEIPPEVNLDPASGGACKKCSSIIYRPIL